MGSLELPLCTQGPPSSTCTGDEFAASRTTQSYEPCSEDCVVRLAENSPPVQAQEDFVEG